MTEILDNEKMTRFCKTLDTLSAKTGFDMAKCKIAEGITKEMVQPGGCLTDLFFEQDLSCDDKGHLTVYGFINSLLEVIQPAARIVCATHKDGRIEHFFMPQCSAVCFCKLYSQEVGLTK